MAGRRLIFCITSGRSGSKYLTDLFATACGVRSFHEAPPNMSGEPLRLVNTLPLEASREVRRVKADAIAALLRGMAPEDVYAETNHMFIKTFFDVVLAEFHNVEVVILRRSLPHVLKSFIEMGYYSPLNPGALAWMSSPNAATAALRALGPDDALDPYDAAIGYLLDIEARAQRFMREYPSVRVREVRLEHLLERQQVAAFLERLDLVPSRTHLELRRTASQRAPAPQGALQQPHHPGGVPAPPQRVRRPGGGRRHPRSPHRGLRVAIHRRCPADREAITAAAVVLTEKISGVAIARPMLR